MEAIIGRGSACSLLSWRTCYFGAAAACRIPTIFISPLVCTNMASGVVLAR